MKVRIIAEAGVNHNGNINTAKKLIKIASNADADYVKFQTFKAENLVTKNAKRAKYQIRNTNIKNQTQFEMLKNLELKKDQHHILLKECRDKKVSFLSTGFDIESLNFLKKIGLKIFKIPSGEITNIPYIRHVGGFRKEIILSTGMSNLKEVEIAISELIKSGTRLEKITLMHCTTDYPTSMGDVNLKAIQTLKDEFNCKVGYSDHTLGDEISIAAIAIGASTIEKHFTISRNSSGPDHKASMEPEELVNMIKKIRNIEKALGDGVKKPSKGEMKNIMIARKSIISKSNINIGDKFSSNNITTKRPGNGISASDWDKLLGKISKKNYKKDDLIDEKI